MDIKKFIAVSIVAFSFAASPLSVLASDSTPSASVLPYVKLRNSEIRQARENINNDVNGDKQTFRASVSAAQEEFRANMAKVHGERLNRRFAFYAARLNNILARIQSRIDKEKVAGKDVTTAQSDLDSAKAKLTQAIKDGNAAVTAFENITPQNWQAQKADAKAAMALAQKARQEFIDARRLMVDAVQTLAQLN
ncbi:MAG TPA: hypothetical protein VLH19_04535 [Patescibacteria group bacterium]|nr:hypothetical protein [Patescibacteria group bacterium]